MKIQHIVNNKEIFIKQANSSSGKNEEFRNNRKFNNDNNETNYFDDNEEKSQFKDYKKGNYHKLGKNYSKKPYYNNRFPNKSERIENNYNYQQFIPHHQQPQLQQIHTTIPHQIFNFQPQQTLQPHLHQHQTLINNFNLPPTNRTITFPNQLPINYIYNPQNPLIFSNQTGNINLYTSPNLNVNNINTLNQFSPQGINLPHHNHSTHLNSFNHITNMNLGVGHNMNSNDEISEIRKNFEELQSIKDEEIKLPQSQKINHILDIQKDDNSSSKEDTLLNLLETPKSNRLIPEKESKKEMSFDIEGENFVEDNEISSITSLKINNHHILNKMKNMHKNSKNEQECNHQKALSIKSGSNNILPSSASTSTNNQVLCSTKYKLNVFSNPYYKNNSTMITNASPSNDGDLEFTASQINIKKEFLKKNSMSNISSTDKKDFSTFFSELEKSIKNNNTPIMHGKNSSSNVLPLELSLNNPKISLNRFNYFQYKFGDIEKR